MKMKNLIKSFGILLLLASGLSSCNKERTPQSGDDEATIKVSLSGAQFKESTDINNRASDRVAPGSPKNTGQRKLIPINRELALVAELSPVVPADADGAIRKAASMDKRAAAEQTDLAQNVKYKLLVFDSSGKYITERDYTRGQESSTAELKLKTGVQYSFVAYSVNSSSALPAVSYTDAQNKTLSSASISGLNGDNDDFMYFRREMTVMENSDNNLAIVLQHKFTLISTKIDASATGYNITEIVASIAPHYPTADVSLDAGTLSQTGTQGKADLTFSGLNAMVVNAAPKQLNANTALGGSLFLTKITIGPITASNLTALDSLSIQPGVKYNLNLSVIPNDTYLTYQGQSAARISGLIWMRHNLGANYNLNPDQDPSVNGLHGNYYQWGRKAVAATATTGAGAISPWNKENPDDKAWNSGSETAPLKTANDPCPSGYRLPTAREMRILENDVTDGNIGTWSESASNYSAARIFKSKRNANVQLTLPIAGNRYYEDGTLGKRGIEGFYWSSTIQNNRVLHYKIVHDGDANIDDSSFDRDWAFPIRCIAAQ